MNPTPRKAAQETNAGVSQNHVLVQTQGNILTKHRYTSAVDLLFQSSKIEANNKLKGSTQFLLESIFQ